MASVKWHNARKICDSNVVTAFGLGLIGVMLWT